MSKNYIYDPELGIAGIEDKNSGVRVYTLLQQPGIKKAAFNAYTGARYSRSDKSIFDIVGEVLKTAVAKDIKVDEYASDRVEKIVSGYGHPSVADMSHNFICMENLPMITIMRYFYLNAKQDGQERSTRFQDFSKPNFYIPKSKGAQSDDYCSILYKSIDAYNELKDETYETLKNVFQIESSDSAGMKALEARTFDTLRFFIPMGMRTSGCAVMSSRDWSRYIGILKGSTQIVENELGDLLFELLTGSDELKKQGYIPESDVLIRHSEANNTSFETIEDLKLNLKVNSMINWESLKDSRNHKGAFLVNPTMALAEHVGLLLSTKLVDDQKVLSHKSFFESASNRIFSKHNHHNQLGPIFQSGALAIKSITDIGSLKDFNRQRSLERFIPFCENNLEKNVLLSNTYTLCEYLKQPGLRLLKAKYENALDDIYKNINLLNSRFSGYTLEELRYLLPHAHQTPYRVYGSLDDLLYVECLRIRPGGHINYRVESWNWRDWMRTSEIFGLQELWNEIKISKPDPLSRDEFINRS